MGAVDDHVAAIVARVVHWENDPRRRLVAIAGPPGAGKSTLAEALVRALNADAPARAALVPMDGFHLDNAILDARGLREVKGAPETFDAAGFVRLVDVLRTTRDDVAIPTFDRDLDLARAGARIVRRETRLLVLEGNYLSLDEAPWTALDGFDLTVLLNVPMLELERRLIQRWRDHGLAPDAARARALSNDIPNARRVVAQSRAADMVLG